jgi:hypothetical protein
MNVKEELEMLRQERILYHNAFANLLNAYQLIADRYFILAGEKYIEPKYNLDLPIISDSDAEYELMKKSIMNKPVRELKFKKSESYLG